MVRAGRPAAEVGGGGDHDEHRLDGFGNLAPPAADRVDEDPVGLSPGRQGAGAGTEEFMAAEGEGPAELGYPGSYLNNVARVGGTPVLDVMTPDNPGGRGGEGGGGTAADARRTAFRIFRPSPLALQSTAVTGAAEKEAHLAVNHVHEFLFRILLEFRQ